MEMVVRTIKQSDCIRGAMRLKLASPCCKPFYSPYDIVWTDGTACSSIFMSQLSQELRLTASRVVSSNSSSDSTTVWSIQLLNVSYNTTAYKRQQPTGYYATQAPQQYDSTAGTTSSSIRASSEPDVGRPLEYAPRNCGSDPNCYPTAYLSDRTSAPHPLRQQYQPPISSSCSAPPPPSWSSSSSSSTPSSSSSSSSSYQPAPIRPPFITSRSSAPGSTQRPYAVSNILSNSPPSSPPAPAQHQHQRHFNLSSSSEQVGYHQPLPVGDRRDSDAPCPSATMTHRAPPQLHHQQQSQARSQPQQYSLSAKQGAHHHESSSHFS
jgi:hypothetical protein